LRDAYHRAGVAEYWLIDAETETLRFEILTRRKDKYVRSAGREGWQRSKVFNRSFRLDRVIDDYGLWEYTLHVREE
jgi:Uma2 family endonuclease